MWVVTIFCITKLNVSPTKKMSMPEIERWSLERNWAWARAHALSAKKSDRKCAHAAFTSGFVSQISKGFPSIELFLFSSPFFTAKRHWTFRRPFPAKLEEENLRKDCVEKFLESGWVTLYNAHIALIQHRHCTDGLIFWSWDYWPPGDKKRKKGWNDLSSK